MKVNEPMRQFMIDRAGTLYYEARQFPQTWRVAVNWICRALYIAKQTGDMDLYRQILHANDPRSDESQEDELCVRVKKTGLRMDSRAFLNAARAVLSDGGLADSQGRIDNATLFTAIEARLGVEKLPRRAWAKHFSSLGLKSTRWNSGKVRGWRLPDVNASDVK